MSAEGSTAFSALSNETSSLPYLFRTPRPYSHNKSPKLKQRHALAVEDLNPPALTPTSSDSERSKERRSSASPEDSGTEADDEALAFTKALPAPNIESRKGLKIPFTAGLDDDTPFLTPSQLKEESQSTASEYFGAKSVEEAESRREKFFKRRRAELVRRLCELVSFSLIGVAVLYGNSLLAATKYAKAEHDKVRQTTLLALQFAALLGQIAITLALLVLYPVRLLLWPLVSKSVFNFNSINLPATFDPAALLYPSFLPVLISFSVSPNKTSLILTNTILGISTLPSQFFPTTQRGDNYDTCHWLTTLSPLYAIRFISNGSMPALEIHPETLVSLFPLHRALLFVLQYLTTTSLLSSEAQLSSVALINVLLMSETPQSKILMILLWVGGVGLFLLCSPILRWNLTVERLPNWRFRCAEREKRPSASYFSKLLHRTIPMKQETLHDNHFTKSDPLPARTQTSLKLDSKDLNTNSNFSNGMPQSVMGLDNVYATKNSSGNKRQDLARGTWNNRSKTQLTPSISTSPATHRKRTLSSNAMAYLGMSRHEIEFRKWSFAIYTYTVTLFLIFVPIRSAIATSSFGNHDPFGWAIGYLFGGIAAVQDFVYTNKLDQWIILPSAAAKLPGLPVEQLGGLQRLRMTIGTSNTRLYLFAYWALVVTLGVATVLQLSSVADVDTRRKVFHGMMVVMLLPTTYIDPCFLSLALILVLAVFLLLELFRAAQLRPVSKPLARFLTPYVDGRDLRGPVVISHIFLLIGCAIPFWLSLADIQHLGDGWEVATRDVSMVAGVICVGMGDAAASLVGRRYGKRKWPWAGAKSLEGSAAFAFAVTVGLLLGKALLKLGHWDNDEGTTARSWGIYIGKASFSAIGASFTEAVLTGANDNVVVPVILWLLIKSMKL